MAETKAGAARLVHPDVWQAWRRDALYAVLQADKGWSLALRRPRFVEALATTASRCERRWPTSELIDTAILPACDGEWDGERLWQAPWCPREGVETARRVLNELQGFVHDWALPSAALLDLWRTYRTWRRTSRRKAAPRFFATSFSDWPDGKRKTIYPNCPLPFGYFPDPARVKAYAQKIAADVEASILAQAEAFDEEARRQGWHELGPRHRGHQLGRELTKGARRLYLNVYCRLPSDRIAELEGRADADAVRKMVQQWKRDLHIGRVNWERLGAPRSANLARRGG